MDAVDFFRLDVFVVDFHVRQASTFDGDVETLGAISPSRTELVAAKTPEEAAAAVKENFGGPKGTTLEIEHVGNRVRGVYVPGLEVAFAMSQRQSGALQQAHAEIEQLQANATPSQPGVKGNGAAVQEPPMQTDKLQ